jgi:superfamily II RNA helicase
MQYKGLTLDQFQIDAIHAIEKNQSVVVSAPTGSGKTLIADYIISKDITKGKKVVYTAPIKALSNQKYREFCKDYGEENIGLITGDVTKNAGAPVVIMTTEIYRNMAIIQDPHIDKVSYVIFDEIHYINDIERGYVWEESVIFSKEHVRFVCLSATIPNAKQFADWIQAIKKHEVVVVRHDTRAVPLTKHAFDAELGICSLEDIRDIAHIPSEHYIRGKTHNRRPKMKAPNHVDLIKGIRDKLPCFFFTFSRKKTQDMALELSRHNLFPSDPEISTFVRNKLENSPQEINNLASTKLIRQVLPYGIGFHHAGLLPIIKEIVEELFGMGKIKVLYTTETFAVGINMPARAVCFESLRKFDGINFRFLNSKEFFQIAGRAGRRGIDKHGFVYSMIDRRDFDYKYLKSITEKDVDPIESQFKLGVNTVLNILKRHTAQEIEEILCKNFYSYQKYGKNFDKVEKQKIYFTFDRIKKKLERLDYIRNDKLLEKGEFCAKIYSDEIFTSEIFATPFYRNYDEYQLMLLIGCICYEARERTEFYKVFPSKQIKDLEQGIHRNEYLSKEKRLRHLIDVSALIHPCFHGQSIFDILKNTNLLEGDIIRFFRQMIDRMTQIRNATQDRRLIEIMRSLENVILHSLQDIDAI